MTAADLDAVRLLLARMGITPEQLLAADPVGSRPMPTFREYIAQVSAAVPDGSRRAYTTYWRRIDDTWGDRRIDEPTPLEIKQLCEQTKGHVITRRNSRGGRSATEHLIAALRCLYRHAAADNLITDADNPALRVTKPRRLPSNRRALPNHRLAEINHTAATTGNDPGLDTLLLRLHTETACRRGGALALRPCDLDPEQCLILLHEKGGTTRWQPISPTLMHALIHHHEQRGAAPTEQLLRYRNGQPITARRYDHLWTRIGQHLPWSQPNKSPPTGSATPPSPGSNATTATPSPAPATPAKTTPAQPPPTSPPTSTKSPPPSPPSPANPTHSPSPGFEFRITASGSGSREEIPPGCPTHSLFGNRGTLQVGSSVNNASRRNRQRNW